MPMYNVITYSNNYSKTSGNFLLYCEDILTVSNNSDIVDY